MEQLSLHRDRLEYIHRHKSKETWLMQGDRSSKFFHTSLLVRRRTNKITFIKDGPFCYSEERKIEDYFVQQFDELFKLECPSMPTNLGGLGEIVVTDEENENLISILEESKKKGSYLESSSP